MELPVGGTITQTFATPVNYIKGRTHHEAVDIVTQGSQPITMLADCKVTNVIDRYDYLPNSGYGNEIWVKYANGDQDRFCHCAKGSIVAIGTSLLKGATGAKTGQTGYRSPITVFHTHWERYRAGKRIDPLSNPLSEEDMSDAEKQMLADHEKSLSAIFKRLDSIEENLRKRASKNRLRKIEHKIK